MKDRTDEEKLKFVHLMDKVNRSPAIIRSKTLFLCGTRLVRDSEDLNFWWSNFLDLDQVCAKEKLQPCPECLVKKEGMRVEDLS